MHRCTEVAQQTAHQTVPKGKGESEMDFGASPAVDGHSAPIPDVIMRMAWFERSSAGELPAAERGLVEGGGGLLDRIREGEGLVYNGEGDYEA